MAEGNKDLRMVREVEKFDTIARRYSDIHAANITASGEGVEYFARYKVNRLLRLGLTRTTRILDYGCGVGNLTHFLAEEFDNVVGYDPSASSIEQARARECSARFVSQEADVQDNAHDVAILAGVLHHIPPVERDEVLARVLVKLHPGGRAVIFEHNPYNPVTRRAVDTCPFDDDAILLPPGEIRSRLRAAGYGSIEQRFIVFFPRILSWFRPLEPAFGFLPVGAQTMTTGRRWS